MDERDLMEYNRLGNTDLIVSKLLWRVNHWSFTGKSIPEEGGRIIARAMEEGLILLIRLICITPTHIRKALSIIRTN